jgi:tetrahydromethanopterin S-methyltransferase subunit A
MEDCEISGSYACNRLTDPWPPLRGEYKIGDKSVGVAVLTLAGWLNAADAAIYGPCKTENLGVEKVVANIISNCYIRYLIVCGNESKGHLPGDAIIALHKNGIDDSGRIIGAKGAIPFIQNISPLAVGRFQEQVEVIDKIGLCDEEEIRRLVIDLKGHCTPFPAEPFVAVQRQYSRKDGMPAEKGDVLFGTDVYLDVSAWLIASDCNELASDVG